MIVQNPVKSYLRFCVFGVLRKYKLTFNACEYLASNNSNSAYLHACVCAHSHTLTKIISFNEWRRFYQLGKISNFSSLCSYEYKSIFFKKYIIIIEITHLKIECKFNSNIFYFATYKQYVFSNRLFLAEIILMFHSVQPAICWKIMKMRATRMPPDIPRDKVIHLKKHAAPLKGKRTVIYIYTY